MMLQDTFKTREQGIKYLCERGWLLVGFTASGMAIMATGPHRQLGIRKADRVWVIERDQRFLWGIVGNKAA